jgi:pyridoxal phosphate enzyme (YggS family)
MNTIAERLQHIQSKIDAACFKYGRKPEEVKLLLATKTVEPDQIRQAFTAGMNYVGENKVQELKRKHPLLKDQQVAFHFIGHLQSNKVRDVLQYADCIQSVDRLSLAEALDRQLQKQGRSMDILMQVNTSYEESKFGVRPEQAISLAKEISRYDTLKVKGLMTIGLFSADTECVRKCFRLLAYLKMQVAALSLPDTEMKELSMGMSGDFETAIGEGATIIRIGTSLFGQRIYPDSYYWNENA